MGASSYGGEMRRGGIIEELEVEMLQGKSIVMCHEFDEALLYLECELFISVGLPGGEVKSVQ
jgi:hypothetical protein